jgi:phage terminase large subunit
MDWNPSEEFWFYTEMQGKRDDIDFITLNYLDNEALDEVTVKEIESHKENKNWWQVYGLGQLGVIATRIYKDWKTIEEIPHTARLEIRGLDFGYTNDPSSLVAIYYHDGGYIVDEELYQKGLSNKAIYDVAKNLLSPQNLIIADSAEPKSIDELRGYGLNILPAQKGADSVVNGIQLVQTQKISVTQRSVNVIKEYRNYLWKQDKDGKVLNVPEHEFSHSMDAIRYAMSSILKKPFISDYKPSAPVLPYYNDRDLAF